MENKNIQMQSEYIQSYLNNIKRIYNTNNNKEFEILSLWLRSDIDISNKDEILEHITGGGNDKSIDAIYLNEEEQKIVIIQSKTSKSFKENECETFLSRINKIFIECNQSTIKTMPDKVKNVFDRYMDFKKTGTFFSISAYYFIKRDKDRTLKTIENNLQKQYDDKIDFEIVDNSAIYHLLLAKVENPKIRDLKFTFESFNPKNSPQRGLLDYSAKDNVKSGFAMLVNIRQIFELFESCKKERGQHMIETIFSENIRRYLGTKKNRINKNIAETLLDNKRNQYFSIFNNGITIIAKDINLDRQTEKSVKCENPQIINGLQTAMTIYNTIKDNEGINFDNSEVLVRLYQVSEDELISEITTSSNSQTAITLGNQLSNFDFSIKLEEFLRNYGFKYIRKQSDKNIIANIDDNTFYYELVLKYWYAIFRKLPHRSKSSKKDVIDFFYQEGIKQNKGQDSTILASDNFLSECLSSIILYKLISKNEKHKIEDSDNFVEHTRELLCYIIAYFMKFNTNEITQTTNNMLQDYYNKAYDVIKNSITQNIALQKKLQSQETTYNNYFKSQKSTEDINNYLKSHKQ